MYRYLFFFATTIVLCQAGALEYRIKKNLTIIGGHDAAKGEAPYQVSLRVSKYYKHHCGGSILTSRTVLTAAHCMHGLVPSDITVWVGTNKLNAGGHKYNTSKLIVHPKWSFTLLSNDIAIIITKTAIKFTKLVKPIPIETKFVGGGVNATLTGWGLTKPNSKIFPKNLQIIVLKTYPNDKCKKESHKPVFENEICTLTKRGEGACNGDSGGPLVRNGKQIGIVSWGAPCAKGQPDVYTRVSSFARWIKNNTVA